MFIILNDRELISLTTKAMAIDIINIIGINLANLEIMKGNCSKILLCLK